jgi:ABC-2 type transport system permease protein
VLVKWAPAWLVKGVASFSFMPHFESSQRGVLDLRDFVYYASVIVFMLAAAHVAIGSRKAA